MNLKTIIIIISIVILVVLGFVAGNRFANIRHQESLLKINKEFIIDKNARVVNAENKKAIIDSMKIQIAELNKKLQEKHNQENYQKPTKDTNYYPVGTENADLAEKVIKSVDKSIPDVNTYIDFGSDYFPEFPDLFENDPRIAITHYKYSDTINDYYLTLKLKFRYKTQEFEVTPSELKFDPPERKYPFTAYVLLTSREQIGVSLSYQFWRINVMTGMLVNRELTGVALVGVGFNF